MRVLGQEMFHILSNLESVHLQPPWTKVDLGREMKEIMTLAIVVGVGSWYCSSEICGG